MILVFLLLSACGQGTWTLTTWGEDYIEQGIPTADFDDGCEVALTRFEVVQGDRALLDGDGAVAGELDGHAVWDLTEAGPHLQGSVEVPATHYDTVRIRIAPFGEAASIHAVGAITCDPDVVEFDWSFTSDTTYLCQPEGLTIPAGGGAETELTVHGDHLFYDGLQDPDAALRARAFVDADVDRDERVTLEELEAVSVADLGYSVGSHAEVTELASFLTVLTRSLGHVDGEGHCQVGE